MSTHNICFPMEKSVKYQYLCLVIGLFRIMAELYTVFISV